MGKRYLIDTSAFSRYVTGRLSEESRDFMVDVLEQEFLVSVITRIELESWLTDDELLEFTIKNSLEDAEIFELSEKTIQKTIEIRRQVKIKLPDAVIAATAIVYDFTLVSTNDKDFIKVPSLKYFSL